MHITIIIIIIIIGPIYSVPIMGKTYYVLGALHTLISNDPNNPSKELMVFSTFYNIRNLRVINIQYFVNAPQLITDIVF